MATCTVEHEALAKAVVTRVELELDHLEVFLARTAFGACPVGRNIFPPRPWRNAFVGRSLGLVVYPAADEAHVFFHSREAVGVKSNSIKPRARRDQRSPAVVRCPPKPTPIFPRSSLPFPLPILPGAQGCRRTSSRFRAWVVIRCRCSPRSRCR